MRRSRTLAKIRAKQPVRLCSLGHFIPAYIRHAAHAGFDCIWLDLEHRAMNAREVQSLLAHFQLFDIDCLLRVTTREKARLYRYLEDGATGLMIPHVSSADEARQLVQSVKFPPLGDRGIDGAGLDADYLVTADTVSYATEANEQTFLVVQIESPRAIDQVNEIAAVNGVDGLFLGPGDLGLRIRQSNSALTLEQSRTAVATAAAEHGKAWGCPASSLDQLRALHELGAQLINYGGEFTAFTEMLQEKSRELSEVYG